MRHYRSQNIINAVVDRKDKTTKGKIIVEEDGMKQPRIGTLTLQLLNSEEVQKINSNKLANDGLAHDGKAQASIDTGEMHNFEAKKSQSIRSRRRIHLVPSSYPSL